ncbi:hypothetical protein MKX01_039589 [Papaver californicum]|nr:hypothetical protein MKX01_039589 [Papaver californicum]
MEQQQSASSRGTTSQQNGSSSSSVKPKIHVKLDIGEFVFDVGHIHGVIETGFPGLWRRYKYDLRDLNRGKQQKKAPKRSAVLEEGSEVLGGV